MLIIFVIYNLHYQQEFKKYQEITIIFLIISFIQNDEIFLK